MRARVSVERRSDRRRLSLKIARITVAGLGGCGPLGALGIGETQLKPGIGVLGRHGRDHGPTLPARMIRYRAN
jgi:hypothetical protein